MIKLVVLVSLILVFFIALPVKAAATYSLIVGLLIFAVLFDAAHKGRRLIDSRASHQSDRPRWARDDAYHTALMVGLFYAGHSGPGVGSGGDGIGVGGVHGGHGGQVGHVGHGGGDFPGDMGADVGDFGGGGEGA